MDARVCHSCGQGVDPRSRFCGHCGNPMEQQHYYQEPPPLPKSMNMNRGYQYQTMHIQEYEEWLWLYSNSSRYIEKWRKNSRWNWASFLLSPFWFGYRKMYAEVAIYMGIILLISILELIFGFNLPPGSNIGFSIFCGVMGNKWYYDKAKREIDRILLIYPGDDMRRYTIVQKGGTSFWGILYVIGMILAVAFITRMFEVALLF